MHVGRLHYTRLGVFGGCSVWIGDRWVLTARHCVKPWRAASIRIDFPAHGKQRYRVKAFHFPAEDKIDLALVELDSPLEFEAPPTLDARKLNVGDFIRLGGYGTRGLVSGPKRIGKFRWGTNTLTTASRKKASFVLDELVEKGTREAMPALMDSGSPVFLETEEEHLLVGVSVSVSDAANPKVGDRANLTCVTGQAEWIRKLAPEVKWREIEASPPVE